LTTGRSKDFVCRGDNHAERSQVADTDGFVIVGIEWPAKALVSFDAMVCD